MELKPNAQRAKIAIVLISLVSIIQIISILSDFLQIVLLKNPFSIIEAEENDFRQRVIGALFIVFYIISAVTFILWFRRAYYNLHTKANSLEYTEGWAAGSWFVPVVNLFRPYRIMKELYLETQKILSQTNSKYKTIVTTQFVGIWWTLWIISHITDNISTKVTLRAETIDDLSTSSLVSIIASSLNIILAAITIKVIYDYSKIEIDFFDIKENEIPVIVENQEA
jgi:hypothetical protein